MTGPQHIPAASAISHLRAVAAARSEFLGGSMERLIETMCADLIERQSAQIERMRAALREARVVIAVDRESFVQCSTAPDQPLDADDQWIVDEYDGLLRMIDAAMGGSDASE